MYFYNLNFLERLYFQKNNEFKFFLDLRLISPFLPDENIVK